MGPPYPRPAVLGWIEIDSLLLSVYRKWGLSRKNPDDPNWLGCDFSPECRLAILEPFPHGKLHRQHLCADALSTAKWKFSNHHGVGGVAMDDLVLLLMTASSLWLFCKVSLRTIASCEPGLQPWVCSFLQFLKAALVPITPTMGSAVQWIFILVCFSTSAQLTRQ